MNYQQLRICIKITKSSSRKFYAKDSENNDRRSSSLFSVSSSYIVDLLKGPTAEVIPDSVQHQMRRISLHGKVINARTVFKKKKKLIINLRKSARIFTIYEISCPNSLKLTKMLVLRLCREIWPEVEWAALKLSPVISTDFDKWVTALGRNKQDQEKVLCSPGRYKRDTKWKILLR